jgi:hypothetical protein
MVFSNNLLLGAVSAAADAYLIEQSLLFDGSTTYLNRTPSTTGNRKTWTYSVWFKRSGTVDPQILLSVSGDGTTNEETRIITSSNQVQVVHRTGASNVLLYQSNAVLRDFGAWYHLVVSYDSTQASGQVVAELNGVTLTWGTSTDYTQNHDSYVNSTNVHQIGKRVGAAQYFDGLMALPILVDGAALDPTSFGELDDDGYWNPIEFAGTATVSWTENLSIDDHASKPSTGTASASSEANAGSAAEHAFNEVTSGGTNTGWQSSSAGSQWLQFEYNTAQTIKAYYVVGHVAAWSLANRAPNSWTIVGSNTGAFSGEEVTIDTVSGESGWLDQEVRWFNCSDNNTAYTYYRMNISSNNGGTLDSVIEWNMFGQNDTGTGFGTNGFVLDFSDTSNFGDDTSGNGNDYTPNNFASTDQLSDTPTDSAADEIGNFARLNSVTGTPNWVFSNDNLTVTNATESNHRLAYATQAVTEGKWYWEVTIPSAPFIDSIGVINMDLFKDGVSAYLSTYGAGWGYSTSVGRWDAGGGWVSAGAAPPALTSNGVIGIALDCDNNKLWFRNASGWINSGDPAAGTGPNFTRTTSVPVAPAFSKYANTGAYTFNFGLSAFTYTPPTGFNTNFATQNFPAPTIADGSQHFVTKLWVGNNTFDGTSIDTGMSSIGLGWVKNRTDAASHFLFDTIRGNGVVLASDSTNAESTFGTSTNYVNEINGADGAGTVRFGASNNTNGAGDNIVGWFWNAPVTPSANTDGSITSSVSANTTSGFSIVTYTGTGSTATVGHGLGKVPATVLVKRRDSASNWVMLRPDLGAGYHLYLDLTNGVDTNPARFTTTNPTSSVFSIGTNGDTNASSGTYVAYCWNSVEDFSKIGSYTGNGSSDGPFIYTGFRPAFLLIRNTGVDNWIMLDTRRDTYNPADTDLYPNLNNGESTASAIDILSNGFKPRDGNTVSNANGGTYIYMAFAENPFQGDDGYTQARAR